MACLFPHCVYQVSEVASQIFILSTRTMDIIEDSNETKSATKKHLNREQIPSRIEIYENLISDIRHAIDSNQQHVDQLNKKPFLSSTVCIFLCFLMAFFPIVLLLLKEV